MLRSVGLGILLVIAGTAEGEGGAAAEDSVCKEDACKKLAEQMEQQMGSNDSCADFHKYVCGNWSGYQEPKPVKLKEKALKDLIGLLDAAAQTSPTSASATDKLIRAYVSCTQKGKDREALKKSVQNVLRGYSLGQWPVLPAGQEEISGEMDYVQILKKSGPRPLFSYSAHTKDDTPFIVMNMPAKFYVSGVDYSDYYTDQEAERSSDEADGTLSPLDEYEQKSQESYKTFITKAISLVSEHVSEDQSRQVADGIIEIEKGLSKLAYQAEEKEEQQMNLSQLSDYMGENFPMTEVLKKDFSVINFTIDGETQVKVKYRDYYKSVVKYLKQNANKSQLTNFVLWTRVRTMAEAEGTLLHDVYLEYQHNISIEGVTANVQRNSDEIDKKSRCIRQLLEPDIMYSAGASYYSRHKFDSNSKKEVTRIFNFIEKEFILFVKNNTWMSQRTKKAALDRLSSMAVVIGYPGWILENSTINFLYKYASNVSKDASFVEHYHQLKENDHFQNLLVLNYCYFNKTNEDVVLRSHAHYTEALNRLAYPAASLVTHYMGPPIPRAVNFGTIGTIFGQLLTSTIERFNDAVNTNLQGDFWDNETTAKFCENSKCLNNTEDCPDHPTYVINSSYQYFRDYNGVRVSHEALRASKGNYTGNLLLPGDKFSTEDKIFFHMFGSLYCPYSVHKRVEPRAFLPAEDLPNSLNEVVSKYEDFNTTFECTGEVKDTCKLLPPQWTRKDPAC